MASKRHQVSYKRPFWLGLYQSIPLENKREIWNLMEYTPHDGQLEVHSSSARFKIVNCGRRWGKTDGVVIGESVPVLALGGWVWACAADYETASISFEAIVRRFSFGPLASLVATDPIMQPGRQRMVLKNGGVLWGKSLYSDKKLRGRGLDLVSIDEAAMQPGDAPLNLALMPALADHIGGLLCTSTPRGRNWFKDRHDRGNKALLAPGQADEYPDWMSWTFPSASNPYLSRAEIERERREKSEIEFRQEYLAEFIDEEGAVFRGWSEIATDEMKAFGPHAIIRKEIKGRHFVVGVDIAVVQDWTVIWVLDAVSGQTVYVERFNQVDHFLMADRVRAVSSMFGDAPVVIDATNNSSFVEMVRDVCSSQVDGFVISSTTRPFLINELGLAIEKKMLSLPDGKTRLGRYCLVEISAFAYVEKAGKKRMEAPQGYHDDVVFALALAHYARMNIASGGNYFRQASREESTSLRDDLSPLKGEEPKKGNVVSGGARKKRINRLSS
jgi:hypothetical protein